MKIRTSSRLWRVVVVSAAALSLFSLSAESQNEQGRETQDITLIAINDFHGRIGDSTVKWAAAIEQIRAEAGEENTLFVSAGDNFGNSLFASSVQGEVPTVDVLNALDLDASAVGNNELFVGVDAFERLAARAEFPYLAANMVVSEASRLRMDAYVVKKVAGVRVAIIGAITPDTRAQFPQGEPGFVETVGALNDAADEIVRGGLADVIVAVVHDGGGTSSPPGTADEELARGGVLAQLVSQASPRIDAFLTGHTHNQYVFDTPVPTSPDRTRPVLQTGAFGQLVGRATLRYDFEARAVTASTAELVPRSSLPSDELRTRYPRLETVARIVEDAEAVAEEAGSVPVGRASAPITTAYSGGGYENGRYSGGVAGQRARESALGTLVANMFRDLPKSPEGNPHIGISLPNFIRSELFPDASGNIPVRQVIEMLGIRDSIVTAEATGAQIKRLLEQQWQRTSEGAARGYIQLALSDNVAYTYDDRQPEGDRITSITIDGEMVEDARKYRIGTTGGIARGLVNFHEGRALTKVRDTGVVDVDGFRRYFSELSERAPVEPDFAKSGARVLESTEFPMSEKGAGVRPGSWIELEVSELDMTSFGSPENTALRILLDGREYGSVPVVDGVATVGFRVPKPVSDQPTVLQLVGEPSGTVVTRTLQVHTAEPPRRTQPGKLSELNGSSGRAERDTDGRVADWRMSEPPQKGVQESLELPPSGGTRLALTLGFVLGGALCIGGSVIIARRRKF